MIGICSADYTIGSFQSQFDISWQTIWLWIGGVIHECAFVDRFLNSGVEDSSQFFIAWRVLVLSGAAPSDFLQRDSCFRSDILPESDRVNLSSDFFTKLCDGRDV